MSTQEDPLANTLAPITAAYSAFNRRDIDGALALMSENVSWPEASEGGRVAGKEEIRAYWTRQWKEFDPHVEPLEVIDREGKIDVKVHQLVKTLSGDVLSDMDFIDRERTATRLHRWNVNKECCKCNTSHVSGLRPDRRFPYSLAMMRSGATGRPSSSTRFGGRPTNGPRYGGFTRVRAGVLRA